MGVRRHGILYNTKLEIHRRAPTSDAATPQHDCIVFSDVRELRLTPLGFELHLKRSAVRKFSIPKAELQAWREALSLAVADSGITQKSASAFAPHHRRQSTPSLKTTAEEAPRRSSTLREASADTRAESGRRLGRSSSSRQLGRSRSGGPLEFERSQSIHSTRSSAESMRRTAGLGRAAHSQDAGGVVRQHRCSSLERP